MAWDDLYRDEATVRFLKVARYLPVAFLLRNPPSIFSTLDYVSIATIHGDRANWRDGSIDREAPYIGRIYHCNSVDNIDCQPCKSTWNLHREDPPAIERTAFARCGGSQGQRFGWCSLGRWASRHEIVFKKSLDLVVRQHVVPPVTMTGNFV